MGPFRSFDGGLTWEVVRYKGGGGGSSGEIDYPNYMETIHGEWLDNAGSDTPTSSITDLMNAAFGNSPYAGEVAYDVTNDVTALLAAVAVYNAVVVGFDAETQWEAVMATVRTEIDANVITDADINADAAALRIELEDQLTAEVLPRFQAGMRNINAVLSSAFVVGQAILEDGVDRDVARHTSKLRVASYSDRNKMILQSSDGLMKIVLAWMDQHKALAAMEVESRRLTIVAESEERATQLDIDSSDAKWDMEAYQYGANVMASIAGGSVNTSGNRPSQMKSAIGGALSGAAAGAMISGGNPIGIGIGAAFGLLSELL